MAPPDRVTRGVAERVTEGVDPTEGDGDVEEFIDTVGDTDRDTLVVTLCENAGVILEVETMEGDE